MKKIAWMLCLVFLAFSAKAQDKPAYQLYDSKGKKVKYGKMLKVLSEADVILFGEIHNISLTHWLQLQVAKDLHQKTGSRLQVGMEMFERDNQLILDEYFSEAINQKYFEDEVRLWDNYPSDYKPLLEYTKAQQIPFTATNIPRRYANMVYKKGLDALHDLSDEAKSYIAPLPIEVDLELPGYKNLLEMMAGTGHSAPNFPHAQAVKDATMAWFLLKTRKEDGVFLHLNGSFHSDNHEGIVWYLNKYQPGLNIVTISNDLQADISSLSSESTGKADFILILPEDTTTSD